MIVLRDPQATSQITDPCIRNLVVRRFGQLNSPDDPDAPDADGYFIVVEPSDTIEQLEQVVGLPIMHSLFDEVPFGHPDFYPCFDILEEHTYEQHRIYEMVFISNDAGFATTVFVPACEGTDTRLLAMCRSFATVTCS